MTQDTAATGPSTPPVDPPLRELPIQTADSGFYNGFSKHVTIPAKIIVSVLIVWAVMFPAHASETLALANETIIRQFAGWYIYLVAFLILVCLGLAIMPQSGSLRLGAPGEQPEFSRFSWFSMLFGAGIGIGMLTYSTGEPLAHFQTNPDIIRGLVEPASAAAVPSAYEYTFLHWGLGAWATYALVGLAVGYVAYRRNLPLTIRSAFYPIFGERVWGWTGHIIDVLAVFATLFGLATSLGFGAQQANAGLEHVFGIPNDTTVQVILITIITGIALISVVRGLDGGVKVLSEINMVIAAVLLFFVLFAAGAGNILSEFVQGMIGYAKDIIPLSNPFGREDTGYMQGWTAFYWAWWISWSPFVGMFIARVSRGRTVREFVVCVLIIPSIVCVLWMATFGGAAIEQVLADPMTSAVKAEVIDSYNPPISLFAMLEGLPLSAITSTIGIVLVIVFFVTSSDSGSLVIDTITAGGKVEAPIPQRVFWCTFEGAVAIVLLLGGGLTSLQAMVISTGLPFTLVLLLMCWATLKGLMSEPRG